MSPEIRRRLVQTVVGGLFAALLGALATAWFAIGADLVNRHQTDWGVVTGGAMIGALVVGLFTAFMIGAFPRD